MKQKIAQMRLIRYLFTAVLALLFVSWNKGRSSDEPKPNNGNGEQTTSSKQVEDEIGFGQREVTLQVGETAKVTLQGARSPRIETSNSNLVEATLVEQRTAVSLKGLQAGEGAIKVFSGNRYAELRVIVKATNADSNNPFNGKNIVWDEISSKDYELSDDGLTLTWKNTSTQNLDMNRDTHLSKIRSIKVLAFWECSNLTNINIPSSVTNIEEAAFYGCSSLTSINIPSSVTSIGKEAFWGCSNLTSINIPNSVTSIGEWAFLLCSNLTSINIPSSVTSIGEYAFGLCSNLTSINISQSVTSIGKSVFIDCRGLTSVNIPDSVKSIGEGAFANCSNLTDINIPSSVTSIGEAAFYGCSHLTSMVFKGNNPPQFSASEVFGNTPSNLKLIVPKGAKSRYIRAGYPEDKLIEQ
ncbi:leucine-rich repeat domain-containing protein [Prevotella sp.]